MADAQDLRFSGLMRATQQGDGAAYRTLLAECAVIVRGVVRAQRAFLQPADIEDLVQDVLLSLHAARATYDPARPFLPWLMAITYRRLADGARRHARKAAHEVQVAGLPVTSAFAPTNMSEDIVGDPELLAAALASLPPGQREAVELLKLRELSLREAAAVTGASESALKVSVHRAMKALRVALRIK